MKKIRKQKRVYFSIMMLESEYTIPIRFSRQSTTELLVAAEQIASIFPFRMEKENGKKQVNNRYKQPGK